jgi:hypothetical protein
MPQLARYLLFNQEVQIQLLLHMKSIDYPLFSKNQPNLEQECSLLLNFPFPLLILEILQL